MPMTPPPAPLPFRWHNQLNPDVNKTAFTEWEQAVIFQVRRGRLRTRGAPRAAARPQPWQLRQLQQQQVEARLGARPGPAR